MNPGTAPAHLMFSRATRQQIVDKRNRVPASQTPGLPVELGGAVRSTCRFWPHDRPTNQEVGQGGQGLRREGAVIDRMSNLGISVVINAPRLLPIAVRENSQAVADSRLMASRPLRNLQTSAGIPETLAKCRRHLSARTIGRSENTPESNLQPPLAGQPDHRRSPPTRATCSAPARRRRARPLPSSPTAWDGGRPYASALPRWFPGSSPPHSPGSAR
jgi:hypothetical protein